MVLLPLPGISNPLEVVRRLLRALTGVSRVASGPDWQQSARRLVDILITGSRPIKSAE
jgi:hypothetical protein